REIAEPVKRADPHLPCRERRARPHDHLLEAAEDGVEVTVKVRSTRPPKPGRVRAAADGGAEVTLFADEESVAPGQACVLYAPEGSRVLGGGWIGR
ncbi:MAG: aminomethyltransferase beta-barrel domain-containing protein, partial [Pseudomonadota bacterium]